MNRKLMSYAGWCLAVCALILFLFDLYTEQYAAATFMFIFIWINLWCSVRWM